MVQCMMFTFISQGVHCQNPDAPTNGKVSGNSYFFGDQIQYECEEGFHLVGNDQAVCSENGTWSAEAPQCKGRFLYALNIALDFRLHFPLHQRFTGLCNFDMTHPSLSKSP
jgi:hypothetical protein